MAREICATASFPPPDNAAACQNGDEDDPADSNAYPCGEWKAAIVRMEGRKVGCDGWVRDVDGVGREEVAYQGGGERVPGGGAILAAGGKGTDICNQHILA